MIKMIIKGRCPTMSHVSRTHRVAFDGLFDRINLDFMIQIKFVDTENQLADMLTKGNFTRDEWNNLLRLFNNMSFSMFSCSHFSLEEADAGEQAWGEGNCGCEKSKPKMSFLFGACQSVFNCTGSECISQPGTLKRRNPMAETTKIFHHNFEVHAATMSAI